MSRPRYYWYGFVQSTLRRYPTGLDCDAPQGWLAYTSIKKAFEDTKLTRDGEEKIRLIRMVYIRKSHNVVGAAMVLHISETVAKRWCSAFIYAVGRNMGFLQ